jgi:hypothetical protein
MPAIIKLVALVGVGYETIGEEFDRPYLLALFGAMLGIGEVVQAATSRSKNGNGSTEEKGKES